MVITTNVSSRLPNSIQVLAVVWPAVCVATRLRAVHAGQSGQPSPDWLSRTAPPVTMIPAFATTLASARPRMPAVLGRQTRSLSRAAALVGVAVDREGPPEPLVPVCVGGRAESPEALASSGALTLAATCSS